MNIAKNILDKALASGNKVAGGGNFLRLYEPDERGIQQPNGVHVVKFIRDETKIGQDNYGVNRQELRIYVDEKGAEKLWTIAVFAKDKETGAYSANTLHYLIPKLAELNPGDTFKVWGNRKGKGLFTDLKKVEGELPTVQLAEHDEYSEENTTPMVGGKNFSEGEEELPF